MSPIVSNDNVVLTREEKDDMISKVEEKFEEIFDLLHFNRNDPQLEESPHRIAKMYVNEVFSGNYDEQPKITVFPNTKEYDEMVVLGPIQIKSMCSHHWMPFLGNAYVAYIPGDKVVGISKLVRITKWFMRRPQIQEELTKQIADFVQETLDPLGVAVFIEATHMCMVMRGVEESENSSMRTSDLRGVFRSKPEVREEFFHLIKQGK